MPHGSALVGVLQQAIREFGAAVTLAFERTEQRNDTLQHRMDAVEMRMGCLESQQRWRPEVRK